VTRALQIKFITAIYGPAHLRFLAPHLFSIKNSNPSSTAAVLWTDLPKTELRLLSAAFPWATFLEMEFAVQGDAVDRVAAKLDYWLEAAKSCHGEGLCFIDTDTLVLKPLERFFKDCDWDVIYTWDNRFRPINTGVVLMRDAAVARSILPSWIELTKAIESNPEKKQFARVYSWSAEQHALREMVGWCNYDGVQTISVEGVQRRFLGVEGVQLNDTECVCITDDTHVLHYKGGWQPVVLGKPYGGNARRGENSRAIVAQWQQAEKAACIHVAEQAIVQLNPTKGESEVNLCLRLCIEHNVRKLLICDEKNTSSWQVDGPSGCDNGVEITRMGVSLCRVPSDEIEGNGVLIKVSEVSDTGLKRVVDMQTKPVFVWFADCDDLASQRLVANLTRATVVRGPGSSVSVLWLPVFEAKETSAPSRLDKFFHTLRNKGFRETLRKSLLAIARRL
jgi:hypothetical protein